MSKDDKTLVNELCASFERQLELYRQLRDVVRANMSRLILTRGDAAELIGGVNKKVKLIDAINKEREDVGEHIEFWHKNRDRFANTADAQRLNDILTNTENMIKEFLAEEEKLKQYVEKVFNKGAK